MKKESAKIMAQAERGTKTIYPQELSYVQKS